MKSSDTQIIEALSFGEYATASELARLVGCSEKTLRLRIRTLAKELADHGAAIEARRGSGFRLVVSDDEAFSRWREARHQRHRRLPNGARERRRHIVERLLNARPGEFVRRADLADELYVSEKTVSADLGALDTSLASFGLGIERVPNRGLLLVGHEFYRRQYMLSHTMSTLDYKDPRLKEVLHALVPKVRTDLALSVPSYFDESLIDYLALTVRRLELGFIIGESQTREWDREVSIYRVARAILGTMVAEGVLEGIPEGEPYFLSLFLWGHQHVLPGHAEGIPRVVPEWSFALADEMVSRVEAEYGIYLGDETTRSALVDFVGAYDVRLNHHISFSDSNGGLVRQEYAEALPLARTACLALVEYYGVMPSEGEVSWLALVLGLALKQKTSHPRRLLLVADMRSPYERLLVMRARERFSGCFGTVDAIDVGKWCPLMVDEYDLTVSTIELRDARVRVLDSMNERVESRWEGLRDVILDGLREFWGSDLAALGLGPC